MKNKILGGLSRREREVLDILYADGSATVGEILDRMTDPPSYSAVRSTLRILEQKGRVKHQNQGRRYVYRPAVAPEAARQAALTHLVTTFFEGSAELAAAALLNMSDSRLSAEQRARLTREIERAKREGR